MTRFARLLRAIALAAALAAPGVAAAEVAPDDSAAIRAIIESQIEAFRQDDGAAAYAFASPGIRDIFPTVEAFMAMVRQQYQPVYRPRSLAFGPVAESPAGPMQKVYVVGPDGAAYVAIYTFERQPDGTWRISGCYLVPDDGARV